MNTEPWRSHLKRIARLPWPGIENAWLFVSAKERQPSVAGPNWPKHLEYPDTGPSFILGPQSETYLTFTYIDEHHGIAAEWDGAQGPIQLWYRNNPRPDDEYSKAGDHWIWPKAYGLGSWSQKAVEEAQLPADAIAGDFNFIFSELRRWVRQYTGETDE